MSCPKWRTRAMSNSVKRESGCQISSLIKSSRLRARYPVAPAVAAFIGRNIAMMLYPFGASRAQARRRLEDGDLMKGDWRTIDSILAPNYKHRNVAGDRRARIEGRAIIFGRRPAGRYRAANAFTCHTQ